MRFFFLPVFLFVFLGYSQTITLQDGDFIFQSIDCGPLCEAINQVTEGYKNHDFNHMGMVVIQNNETFVMEAAGTEVSLTPYDAFVGKTEMPMYVGRLKRKYRRLIPQAINFGKKQLGKPYDVNYLYDNEKYYCSELIYDCFLNANGKPFFKLFPMTYKAPGSDSYFKVWEDYFKNLNMEVPEGKPGCNPGGMSLSNKIKILGTL